MSGDGGLGMLLGELLTVALHGLPVNYAAIAAAAGIHAGRIEQPTDK